MPDGVFLLLSAKYKGLSHKKLKATAGIFAKEKIL